MQALRTWIQSIISFQMNYLALLVYLIMMKMHILMSNHSKMQSFKVLNMTIRKAKILMLFQSGISTQSLSCISCQKRRRRVCVEWRNTIYAPVCEKWKIQRPKRIRKKIPLRQLIAHSNSLMR